MNRERAYAKLALERASYGAMSRERLVRFVDQSPITKILNGGDDEVELELHANWLETSRHWIRITGIFRGLSAWRNEILEESLVVSVS